MNTVAITPFSVFENARQVVLDGYVSAFEDGSEIRLHWVSTRGPVSTRIACAILQMIDNEEVVITEREAFTGTYFLELVPDSSDCETVGCDCN